MICKIRFSLFCFILTAASFANGCIGKHLHKSPIEKAKPAFDKQGHRGARGLMPENTIAGFLKAMELGVNTLELDVVISKDKMVVISHDPYFNYKISTKPDGKPVTQKEQKSLNLYLMDYAEIVKYDVGLKYFPEFPNQKKIKAYKPLLSQLTDTLSLIGMTMKRPPERYNIEIKSTPAGDHIFHPDPKEFADLVMAQLKESNISNRSMIQSFDMRPLQYLNKNYPEIPLSLLIDYSNKNSFAENLNRLGFTPAVYSPNYLLVTPHLIKECHEAGVKIIPWTVNTIKEIERLKNMGVDGIITDYPNLFNELSEEL